MRFAVEVLGTQEAGDARDGVAVDQNASENRLFGFNILRGEAFVDH